METKILNKRQNENLNYQSKSDFNSIQKMPELKPRREYTDLQAEVKNYGKPKIKKPPPI